MLTDTRKSPYAKVAPLPWNASAWQRGFWQEEEKICESATIPQLKRMFDDKDISHVVENFKICAGEAQGPHDGTVFGDGDFYKWMEAAAYAAVRSGDEEMLTQLDDYIDLIGRAQQPDGYLSTKQIIGERDGNGVRRMGDINDFEVYNFGHLFTTAALYYRLTGKDNLLQIAAKTADYLDRLYEEAMKSGEVQTAVCPSHYMGLIELYRATGEEKYLRLANTAIELRDSVKNGTDDNQDRIPLKTHKKIVGHAVRSNYLYAGVADLYLEKGGEEYREMLERVWDDLLSFKIYITGGCGALYNGVSPYGNFFVDQKIHQAYGYEYQLPNVTAYNETCANIGLVMWAYRMFLAAPKGQYFDIIERVMLNTNLAAVSLDGMKFFYENMLERAGHLEYELVWPLSRTDYITSYCCPPNLARILSQSAEYCYTVSEDTVYTGMYGANKAQITLENGASFTLTQETTYPYDGTIRFRVSEVKGDVPSRLAIRVPGWVRTASVRTTEGERWEFGKDAPAERFDNYQDGYLFVPMRRLKGFGADVNFEMPVRYTVANEMIEEDRNAVAVERGPLVFCMETPDAVTADLDDLRMKPVPDFKLDKKTIAGRTVMALV